MTDIDICNMALANLGITGSVASITSPTTKEEKACATFYGMARDKLLGMADWPFARKHAVLYEDTASADPEFSYAYTLPTDCVKVRRVEPMSVAVQAAPYTFKIGLSVVASGKRLYCDVAPVSGTSPNVRYTADVDEGLYSAEFADALAWELASRVGAPLRADSKMIVLARQMAKVTAEEAWSLAANEAVEHDDPDGEYVRARG